MLRCKILHYILKHCDFLLINLLSISGAWPHGDHACVFIQLEPWVLGAVPIELLVGQVPIIQIVHIDAPNFSVRCLPLKFTNIILNLSLFMFDVRDVR